MVDPRSVQTAQSRSRVVSQFEKFESKSPEHKGTKVKSKDTKNAFLRVLAVAVLCAFVPLCLCAPELLMVARDMGQDWLSVQNFKLRHFQKPDRAAAGPIQPEATTPGE
ncbi:MAG: hypothetical protein ACT6T0_02880 [Nevskia sp.]|uniref:hypothetical protein n=1 Tax=Nevskia sp. TaxID=1929292 RepID=UPI0040361F78